MKGLGWPGRQLGLYMNDRWRAIERFHGVRLLVFHRLPRAFYGRHVPPEVLVPVFSQHGPGPKYLTPKLEHLARNRYETISTRQYTDWLAGRWAPRAPSVMLTFDDGLRGFAERTFPVLRTFGFRSVLFVCPGLTDLASAGSDDVSRLARRTILTWDELRGLHETGLVDVQSHGLWHNRVLQGSTPTGIGAERIEDIMFNADLLPPDGRLERALAGQGQDVPRFRTVPKFMQRMGAPGSEPYTTVLLDLVEAKQRIEAHLPGHRVRAFAFPWWNGSTSVLQTVKEAGYELAFWGLAPICPRCGRQAVDPFRVGRLGFDWILCLPGKGRTTVRQLIREKLKGLHDERA